MRIVERRKQTRLPLHWVVYLSSGFSGEIETNTVNLGVGGFYCILPTAFTVGEVFKCDIALPAYGRGSSQRTLHGRGEVVRVETRGNEAGFGVAFRFMELCLQGLRDQTCLIGSVKRTVML